MIQDVEILAILSEIPVRGSQPNAKLQTCSDPVDYTSFTVADLHYVLVRSLEGDVLICRDDITSEVIFMDGYWFIPESEVVSISDYLSWVSKCEVRARLETRLNELKGLGYLPKETKLIEEVTRNVH